MSLKVTPANPTFDKKLRLLGYEVIDLIALLIVMSVLNFAFGEGYKLLCVWLPSAILAMVLRVGKIGKPENYILHLVKFHLTPGVYSAYQEPSVCKPAPRLKVLRGRN